jgi:hypothetical protein
VDPIRNPYTPNAGAQPPAVIGRDAQIQTFEVLLKRMAAGRSEQSMIITGLRGVGKTVLLGRFERTARAQDWVVVEREISKHDNSEFRRQLAASMRTTLLELSPRARWTNRIQRAAGILKSFAISVDPTGSITAGIDVEAYEGLADRQDLQSDLTDLLVAIGEAAADSGRGVVLLFDEVQFFTKPQLEALISAVHKTVQRGLPITMVGAGLPQIAELAGDAKSYAERLFKFPRIGNLTASDAGKALANYFIQELGYAVWGIARGPIITRADVDDAVPLYESKLDESFFRVRLDRATEMQRAYLRAMAELGPEMQKAQAVADVMSRKSTQLGPTRAQLIDMGLLFTPEHGYAEFTVPHFDKFMLRAIPELVVPPPRPRKVTG